MTVKIKNGRGKIKKCKDRNSVSEENTRISKTKAIMDKGKISQAKEPQTYKFPFVINQKNKINEKGPFT